MSLGRYAVKRLAFGVIQVIAVATVVFLLVQALPGDAAVALAGDDPNPERIEQIRTVMGLDRPPLERFGAWLWGLAHLDLGVSIVSGRPVSAFLSNGLAPTAVLAVLTLVLLVPLSVMVGVLAALREGSRLDRVLTSISVGLHSIPEFALAVVLIALFGVQLAWLPPTAVGVGGDLLGHPEVLVLPLVVLLARPICSISRLVRAGMIEALSSDYVRHARRLGLSVGRVRFAHALPNALAPAVQQVARTTDWLLGGVIVVEAVFVIPGLGTTLVDAVASRDLPVVQGLAVVFAVTTVAVNLIADLVAFRLSPRAVGIR
ncbi:peptide/nickel transport system permease protein [Actinokineospora alba]|uniref:Peptide/nickel transport system permease protein n=1 Tax=Actinokineospora alba TaxID=504798 RepID=A0A1H0KF43_9PSEU|nr:ABC transporter permease [Actinokineospora alba]TDP67932.1 peptide/nickel transport system permease protein [Actinokineospora alba]SDH89069.1 peptide/nickel transport system permease protein [Actinokineospora alba]SDO54371.1 peptide/nickel transport system permease protein [Actinokineospora alba]